MGYKECHRSLAVLLNKSCFKILPKICQSPAWEQRGNNKVFGIAKFLILRYSALPNFSAKFLKNLRVVTV